MRFQGQFESQSSDYFKDYFRKFLRKTILSSTNYVYRDFQKLATYVTKSVVHIIEQVQQNGNSDFIQKDHSAKLSVSDKRRL